MAGQRQGQGNGLPPPGCPDPAALPAHPRSSLASHTPGSPKDLRDMGEQGQAHPTPPCGTPPSCHGSCRPPPCPQHPQGTNTPWLSLVPAAGTGTPSLPPSPAEVGQGPGWPEPPLGTILLRVLSQVVQGAGAGLDSGL